MSSCLSRRRRGCNFSSYPTFASAFFVPNPTKHQVARHRLHTFRWRRTVIRTAFPTVAVPAVLLHCAWVAPVEAVAPEVSSTARQTTSSSPTSADSVEWRLTFDQDVQNVTSGDFTVTLSGIGTVTITVDNAGDAGRRHLRRAGVGRQSRGSDRDDHPGLLLDPGHQERERRSAHQHHDTLAEHLRHRQHAAARGFDDAALADHLPHQRRCGSVCRVSRISKSKSSLLKDPKTNGTVAYRCAGK